LNRSNDSIAPSKFQARKVQNGGLVNIAPAVECSSIQGTSVSVHGISANGLAVLLGRYPELKMLMTGKEVGASELFAMGVTPLRQSLQPVAVIPATTWQRVSRVSYRSTLKPTFQRRRSA
jgi:hypothetical protein